MNEPASAPPKETVAQWLGLNRATLAVLAVIGCLGLSEEIWSNFLSLHRRLDDRRDMAVARCIVREENVACAPPSRLAARGPHLVDTAEHHDELTLGRVVEAEAELRELA